MWAWPYLLNINKHVYVRVLIKCYCSLQITIWWCKFVDELASAWSLPVSQAKKHRRWLWSFLEINLLIVLM